MYQKHSLASVQATSDEDLEATIALLLSQIKSYKHDYEALDKKSTEVGDEFAELYPAYNDLYMAAAMSFNSVAAELDRVTREREAGDADERVDEADDEHDQDSSSSTMKAGNDLSGKGGDAPISVNKLYRRIAQLAHPDKTDDKSLHEMFMRAKEAKKANALSELISILASIKGEAIVDDRTLVSEEDLRADQLSRIAALRRELEMVLISYRQLSNSPMAKVVDLVAAGTDMAKARAEILYKTTILDRAKQLETKASSMKQDLAFRGALKKNTAVSS